MDPLVVLGVTGWLLAYWMLKADRDLKRTTELLQEVEKLGPPNHLICLIEESQFIHCTACGKSWDREVADDRNEALTGRCEARMVDRRLPIPANLPTEEGVGNLPIPAKDIPFPEFDRVKW